jgi:large subunit ribosomal protein L47
MNQMHQHIVRRLLQRPRVFAVTELPPLFLAPSLQFNLNQLPSQCASFSSTSVAGRGRDLSKSRGVSAIHRTGPKFPLGVSKFPLPTPIKPEALEPRNPTTEHGLWEFFPRDRQALSTPEYDVAHGVHPSPILHSFCDYDLSLTQAGRPWSVQELREKSWGDLHCLWWVCVKERNRIATSNLERKRLKAGYGSWEASECDRVVSFSPAIGMLIVHPKTQC